MTRVVGVALALLALAGCASADRSASSFGGPYAGVSGGVATPAGPEPR